MTWKKITRKRKRKEKHFQQLSVEHKKHRIVFDGIYVLKVYNYLILFDAQIEFYIIKYIILKATYLHIRYILDN